MNREYGFFGYHLALHPDLEFLPVFRGLCSDEAAEGSLSLFVNRTTEQAFPPSPAGGFSRRLLDCILFAEWNSEFIGTYL